VTAVQTTVAHDEVDRNLAFVTYGLLFFSVFFAGVPALIAVAIAYARRKDVDPLVRNHHSFQIWIFWIGFLMALLGGAAGLTAMTLVLVQMMRLASIHGWHGLDSVTLPEVIGPTTLAFGGTAILLLLCAGLWLLFTSVYGCIKLASQKPMSQTAR
jgi:uncharacterized membrane protein